MCKDLKEKYKESKLRMARWAHNLDRPSGLTIRSITKAIKDLEFTQSIASRVITELHVERGQLKDRIRVLERENEQLRQDLEYERHLNESRIANMNIQINNSQNREDILREALNNIEDVRTISPLRRQGAFLFEDEVLDSD
ncbi:hypothetical protein C2G38_2232501 [Gigaspora rosea]|uniref:Uncharacterized protein n=1 Tax=Gigaspora rosea TaxID=44941 RepID=A0A397TSA2_9GLOM|nr:hypothetical protein C2G38_2232501 [Gigaspora rosea]